MATSWLTKIVPGRSTWGLVASTRLPALLRVCRTARDRLAANPHRAIIAISTRERLTSRPREVFRDFGAYQRPVRTEGILPVHILAARVRSEQHRLRDRCERHRPGDRQETAHPDDAHVCLEIRAQGRREVRDVRA